MTGFKLTISVVAFAVSAIAVATCHAQSLRGSLAHQLVLQAVVDEHAPAGPVLAVLDTDGVSVSTNLLKTADTNSEDTASAPGCPSSYPRTLPCVSGGELVYEEPSRGPRFPGILVLSYATDMESLYSAIEEAAAEGGWAIESPEIGFESDGRRYRAQLRKVPELVGVSVYTNAEGKALLQLMLWPIKERPD